MVSSSDSLPSSKRALKSRPSSSKGTCLRTRPPLLELDPDFLFADASSSSRSSQRSLASHLPPFLDVFETSASSSASRERSSSSSPSTPSWLLWPPGPSWVPRWRMGFTNPGSLIHTLPVLEAGHSKKNMFTRPVTTWLGPLYDMLPSAIMLRRSLSSMHLSEYPSSLDCAMAAQLEPSPKALSHSMSISMSFQSGPSFSSNLHSSATATAAASNSSQGLGP
mmetsp:Transcript_14698/g.35514  ORF Transcript_14698/g.35514 Transcript_14698/m.35514 type:complete len:222 (+) Transcript_14698:469-1134(+)